MSEDGKNWYAIHTYAGYEERAKANLEQRIEHMDMGHKIFEVIVPKEEEIEIKGGQKYTMEKKMLPGYILVQMKMDEESWYAVRNTPGVSGFVSSGSLPVPLSEEEVQRILERMRSKKPKVKVGFSKGENVRIIEGPFTDFIGTVDEIDLGKGKMRLMVSFFGRETPLELDFSQVQKV